MKSLDLEWIANNWEQASEADRLAAGKEMRKRMRASVTHLEKLGRMLAPKRTDPATLPARIQQLRALGFSLQDAAAAIRERDAHLPPRQSADAPELRQRIRVILDEVMPVVYAWADRCPTLEPAWTDLERRAADLHTKLRIDDSEVSK